MQYDPGSGVPDRIKRAMAKRRMNIRQLSKHTGIPYRSLQNYLLETRGIPADAIKPLCDALSVSADWLLTGEGARLDHQTLIDCLSVIEDVRLLSDNKTSIENRAAMFANFYVKFYSELYPALSKAEEADIAAEPKRRLRPGLAR